MIPSSKLFLLLAVGGVLVTSAGPAHAQKKSPAAKQEVDERSPTQREADERFRLGKKASEEGRAEEARLLFLQAYAVDKTPNTLWNLALSELDSNHPVDAAAHFRAYLADPNGKPEKKTEAKKLLATELWTSLGHVRVAARRGIVLRIDDRDATPDDVTDVTPGTHVITAGEERRTVDLPAGKQVDVSFEGESSAFWTTGRYVGAGLGIAGVATTVAAIGFTIAANNNASKSQSNSSACYGVNSSACDSAREAEDGRVRDTNIATALWIGGGTLLVAGVTTFILARPSDERPASNQAVIFPTVAKEGAGIHVHLRF